MATWGAWAVRRNIHPKGILVAPRTGIGLLVCVCGGGRVFVHVCVYMCPRAYKEALGRLREVALTLVNAPSISEVCTVPILTSRP